MELNNSNYRGFHFEYNSKYYLYDINTFDICEIEFEVFNSLNNLQEKQISRISPKILNKFFILSDNNLFWGEDEYCDIKIESDTAFLSIAPIYDCNLRCRYCFADSGNQYTKNTNHIKSFDEQTLISILDSFINLFPNEKNYRVDLVSGGEPLLNFEIITILVKYIQKFNSAFSGFKKIKLWVCTNGTLLSNKINQFLSDNNVEIGISLDGPKKVHDKFRFDKYGKGTYDTIVENYQNIKNSNTYSLAYKDIWGLSVVNSLNCNIINNLKHFNELGFNNVQFKLARLPQNSELALNKSSLHNIIHEYEKFTTFLLDSIKENDIKYILMILNDNDYYGKILKRLILKEIHAMRCWAGSKKITICPNGDVYPCDSFVGIESYKMGNIFKSTNLNFNIIDRRYVTKRNRCKTCKLRYLCGGDCYYNSYLMDESCDEPNDNFCLFMSEICKMTLYLYFELKYNYNAVYERIEKILKHKKRLLER